MFCLDVWAWRGVADSLKMKARAASAHGCYLFTPRAAAQTGARGGGMMPALLSSRLLNMGLQSAV